MITFQVTAEIKDDRQVVLSVPPEVPIGHAELVVSIQAAGTPKIPPGSADWVEVEAGFPDANQSGYPLRGSVVRYDQPTEPVAEEDWEALR
jgi:hypothetical protein